MMIVRSVCVLVAVLIFSAAYSEDSEIINTRLKVDLNEIVSAGHVEPLDGISAAGQPGKAAFKVFADSGYTTVIDLRGANENRGLNESEIVAELGMEYVLFPVIGMHDISFENAAKLDALVAAADGPVLIHCGSSNRVGALLALSKSLEGASSDVAMSHGINGGLSSLAAPVEALLAERQE